ncbi:MAG: hypothetical protein IJ299_05725 [Oscillospiraceae bacterium]|nr:hypothetical protein [Oscillospiraceae bacterium]
MKAFKVNPTTLAASFTRAELSALGIGTGSLSGKDAHTLAGRAFTYLGEHPRRFSVRAYVSDAALLLFAEESPDLFRIMC